ncbi:MAG: transglycosylase domain-containing protein [Chloroflexi bacterium]|nr:transglycosylase domain-containing protein [Chloroflexota bacterium]
MPTVAHTIRRRHSRKRRRSRETRRSAFWSMVVVGAPLAVVVTPLLGALALSLWLYLSAASLMPEPQETALPRLEQGETRFFDATDQTIVHTVAHPLDDGRRWLKLDDLPPYLVSASMMAEGIDEHDPFDPTDAMLQVWRYIIGLPVESEDGLSGKLARETLLSLTRTSGLDTRLLEIVHVAESKRRYSAEELLEWRLNTSYYGRDAFGIEAAAQAYLGKSAVALSLAESALLAPIVADPSLNPIDAPAQARERGADLLFQMLDAELIDKSQFDAASAFDVALRKPDARQAEIAPAFIIYARRQAEDLLDSLGFSGARLMARGALQITTSLNLELHLQAECALRAHLRQIDQVTALDGSPCVAASELAEGSAGGAAPPVIGALALIDVGSGRILSMVGEAEAASHQPAVVLQPFVYLEAFLRRQSTPASMVYDLPRAYPGASADLIYAPANPDGLYRGPLNLRDAMAAGLLPPAVQVASVNGMGPVIDIARAIGFNSLDATGSGLSLLERGGAVSVLDTAYAYSVLATMGAMRGLPIMSTKDGFRVRDPVAILRIEDASGRALWSHDEAPPANETLIIQPSAAYMVNDILADADARVAALPGRDSNLRISRRAAAVDGMSADKRDSWTVGHSPDLALAVHTNRADGKPLGSAVLDRAGSAPLWRALMDYAHTHLQLPDRYWSAPADIEEYLVCEISGLLPATTAHCPTRKELAPAGSALQRDHYWQTFEINRADGQLATVNTPDELRETLSFFIPPDDVMDWWLENGKPLPPSSYSGNNDAGGAKPTRIISPADYAYVGARVEIDAVVDRADAESWLLEYGADVNPAAWTSIGERQPLDDTGDIAATWETALFSGIYTLRLSVTFADGSVETDSKLLTFDNTPPAVKLRTGDGNSVIRYPAQRVISLQADVKDNLTIERVAFYREDELVSDDRAWPFGVEIALEEIGDIVFKAIVYDQVGNRASSELAVSVVDG